MSRSRRQRGKQWLNRQNNDTWVKRARESGYRSRAAHKLEAIDQQDRLLRPGLTVLDLGAAPGSWSQYARSKVGDNGLVVAVDRLTFPALDGVHIIEGDITEPDTVAAISELIPATGVDLVISDMAPNITGIRSIDEANFEEVFLAIDMLCSHCLRRGGHMVAKVFEGEAAVLWQKRIVRRFDNINKRKPAASRDRSREHYLVARNFRAQTSKTTKEL